jgi:hypothetical protein
LPLAAEYLVSNNLGNQIGGSADVGFVEVTIWGWTIKYNPRMSVSKVHLLHGPSLAPGGRLPPPWRWCRAAPAA